MTHFSAWCAVFRKPIFVLIAMLCGVPLAAAQNCDFPATGKVTAFGSPPTGTKIRFQDVILKADTTQTRREVDYIVTQGTETETDWTIRLASGQGIAVRTFMGLIQLANSGGTSSQFDRDKFAALWPLDVGKTVTFDMTTGTETGTRYGSRVSFCVRSYEKLGLQAGEFDTVMIDSHVSITQGNQNLPFDEVYTRYWYAPQFGIYLQRVRAMYLKKREVMKQTRRATKIEGG